jgi:DNA-binding NarL/FixJ family response regulator
MKIAIADDHPIFRSGLKALLANAFPKIEIAEFTNGQDVLDYIIQEKPELAILDIDMPELTGLEVCKEVSDLAPTGLIILTMYNDVEMQRKAFSNGAKGFLVKDNTTVELVECIQTVLNGDTYTATGIKIQDENQDKSSVSKQKQIELLLSNLTQVELKTLKLVSQKYSSREIADLLFISTKSVENYRSRICKKLELDARNNSLLIWVMENKPYLEILDEFK